jgi:hypothetical protein
VDIQETVCANWIQLARESLVLGSYEDGNKPRVIKRQSSGKKTHATRQLLDRTLLLSYLTTRVWTGIRCTSFKQNEALTRQYTNTPDGH